MNSCVNESCPIKRFDLNAPNGNHCRGRKGVFEVCKHKEERTMTTALTAEQQIAVIRRAAEKGYSIVATSKDTDGCGEHYNIYYGLMKPTMLFTHQMTFNEALTRLSSLFPVPPRWQDDKGWQGVVRDCRSSNRSGDCLSCAGYDPNFKGLSAYHCQLKIDGEYPEESIWHPPINPATGEPYLTLALWEADNAKPALPAMSAPLEGGEQPVIITVVHGFGNKDEYVAKCTNCGTVTRWYKTELEAINCFNQRPPLPEGLTVGDIDAMIVELLPKDMPASSEVRANVAMLQALKERI